MKVAVYILKNVVIYMALCMATFLMLRGIVIYYPLNDHTGFLQFKQAYINIMPWKIAFYVHVFTVLFALLAGFTQFSGTILQDHRNIHRLMGRVYAYDIFLNFPFAMIMAIYANGLLPGKIAFVVLDTLWFWFTCKAVMDIRKGDIANHRANMIRS